MKIEVDGLARGREAADALGDERPDIVLRLLGHLRSRSINSRSLHSWLRQLHRSGVTVGAHVHRRLDPRQGRPARRQALRHPLGEPAGLSPRPFPKAEVYADLFEVDNNIYTCAGGTALARHDADADRRRTTARRSSTGSASRLLTDRVREPARPPAPAAAGRLGIHNPKVLTIIELMEAEHRRAAVARRARPLRRPVAPPDRAAVPAHHGPLAGALLSRAPPRPGPPPAAPVEPAGRRGGGRLRLRLRLAFLEVSTANSTAARR